MSTNTVLDLASPVLVVGTSEDRMETGQREALLADATAHLLFAYEAIDEFSQISTEQWASRAFVSACRSLCATLIAIDEYSESTWANV